MKKRIRISATSSFHYFRLVFRSILLIVGVLWYIDNAQHATDGVWEQMLRNRWFLRVIWVVFAFEMVSRFFPSKIESPGCQKQFKKNYIKTGETDVQFPDNNATVLVGLVWLSLNGVIGALKITGILDEGIMVLICLFYSVCDMICILFFCPFQSWFLKNKCCASCRIYNWDYAMMFTPLFFVRGWYSGTLLIMSFGLLFRWEITIFHYPERFCEKTNGYLSCQNCTEKLCTHKKQLSKLRKQIAAFTKERIDRIKG